METGRIVLINGTSSAGKTTIARAFQEYMPEMWLLTGVDVFQAQVHRRWFVHSESEEDADVPGWKITWRDGKTTGVQLGELAQRCMRNMYESAVAIARGGTSVVMDDVLHDGERRRSMVASMADQQAYLVGVRCPLEIAESRERERGDRRAGGARLFYETAHKEMAYDIDIDSSLTDPTVAAAMIAQRLSEPATALAQMRVQFGSPVQDP